MACVSLSSLSISILSSSSSRFYAFSKIKDSLLSDLGTLYKTMLKLSEVFFRKGGGELLWRNSLEKGLIEHVEVSKLLIFLFDKLLMLNTSYSSSLSPSKS